MDQFEEAKETNQKWKYSNERTIESWQKVEATAMGSQGSSLKKIESKVEKSAVMIVHVLSGFPTSSYPIRRALVQHISQRVSVESVINERKNSCHFAWRNGSSTCSYYKYGSYIRLERFSYQSKIISINIRISLLLSREKVKHARFLESLYSFFL